MRIEKNLVHPKKLHLFNVVAKLGNITHAAQHLHLSQPAVSNSIASLEEFFNTKLYHVSGKTIIITEAGRRLLSHWSRIQLAYQGMNDELGAIKSGEAGDVSLGMVSTAKYFIPSFIKKFSVRYPKVNFSCDITDRRQCVDKVLSHQYSLGILTEPPHHPDLSSIKLGKNPLLFICHPENKLAKLDKVNFHQLAKESFITREHSAQITQNLLKLFEKHQQIPNIGLSINSTEAIKEAVIENFGIALMPTLSVHRELANKKVCAINFSTKTLTNDWYLITIRDKMLDSATESFLALSQQYFAEVT